MLAMAVAGFCSDNNAMYYVLPILWMTSCFHIGQNQRRRCSVDFAMWRYRGRSV